MHLPGTVVSHTERTSIATKELFLTSLMASLVVPDRSTFAPTIRGGVPGAGSAGQVTAVDRVVGTGGERRAVAGQPGHQLGDLLRFTESLQRVL